jgi:hypothetical protein
MHSRRRLPPLAAAPMIPLQIIPSEGAFDGRRNLKDNLANA